MLGLCGGSKAMVKFELPSPLVKFRLAAEFAGIVGKMRDGVGSGPHEVKLGSNVFEGIRMVEDGWGWGRTEGVAVWWIEFKL